MSWQVFAGEYADEFAAVILQRAVRDGFTEDADGAAHCLRAHVHRGLGYLASERENSGIADFIDRWLFNRKADS